MDYEYEMFSEAGDCLVHDLIKMAAKYGLGDVEVLAMCSAVAKNPDFSEITDTAVRERIGEELGWFA